VCKPQHIAIRSLYETFQWRLCPKIIFQSLCSSSVLYFYVVFFVSLSVFGWINVLINLGGGRCRAASRNQFGLPTERPRLVIAGRPSMTSIDHADGLRRRQWSATQHRPPTTPRCRHAMTTHVATSPDDDLPGSGIYTFRTSHARAETGPRHIIATQMARLSSALNIH